MNASPGTTRDENGFPGYCRPDRLCAGCQLAEPVAPVVSSGYRGATCAWCGAPRSPGQSFCPRCAPYQRQIGAVMDRSP